VTTSAAKIAMMTKLKTSAPATEKMFPRRLLPRLISPACWTPQWGKARMSDAYTAARIVCHSENDRSAVPAALIVAW
jgi:hypothetical protein